MFYQLIDIEEPKIQAIMHENDGQVWIYILLCGQNLNGQCDNLVQVIKM